MTQKPEETEEEEDRHNVTELKLITGGKGTYDETNWLGSLKKGTIFTTKTKRDHRNFMVLQLQIHNKTDKTTILYENLMDKLFGRVENVRFCNEFDLVEILWEPEGDWPIEETEALEETKDEQ